MMELTLGELARRLGGELIGDGEKVIRGLAGLESAAQDQLAFLANSKYEKLMETTSAGAVIVSANYAGPGANLIRCADAYFAFREAMMLFHGFRKHPFRGVDARAAVAASAKLGADVAVAHFATVCEGATIGDRTVIYPGVFVGPGVNIGDDCIVYPNVTLYDGTVIGDRVILHAGTSVGHDGFGYATHKGDDGVTRHEKIPQAGWVVIEDDCEVGANCAIDRATMGATILGAGTKLASQVMIGHGTKMGKHCLMVAQVGIAGSATVGNYCVFAGQVGVVGHIRIGDGVKVGAQSGIINDVPAGKDILGSPAVDLSEGLRIVATTLNLPKINATVKKLAKEVEVLKKQGKRD
ncbi:MAG: UDP-3-O-(3-hydroxymyristoyl)glucosamine N-acyltransferase [Phycisphaerae bacterium]|nr:UDP-3-O-(3-hydroxymyristoyl)glucosamine N-acyltransferase [Phycisphaerae bacterium]